MPGTIQPAILHSFFFLTSGDRMIQSTVWSSRLLLALGPNSTPLRTNICPTGSVIQSAQWIFYPEIGRSKGHPSCFNGSTGLIGSTILLLDLENNGPRKNSGKVRPRIGDENFHDFILFFFAAAVCLSLFLRVRVHSSWFPSKIIYQLARSEPFSILFYLFVVFTFNVGIVPQVCLVV